METKLIIVRHGYTDWNQEHKFQGQRDIPLNKKGKRQARQTAAELGEEKIDSIYCSDLKRARKTARLINKEHELEINLCKKLRELNFGDWEGCTYREIKQNWPDLHEQWQENPVKYPPPAGEKLADFKERIEAVFSRLVAGNKGETVLVVTHGGVIRVYLTVVLDLFPDGFWQFNIDQAAINIIKFFAERVIINGLNCKCHLKE